MKLNTLDASMEYTRFGIDPSDNDYRSPHYVKTSPKHHHFFFDNSLCKKKSQMSDGAMTMNRWCNDTIKPRRLSHRASPYWHCSIAVVSSHLRFIVIAPSCHRYRTIVPSPLHYRVIAPSTETSIVRQWTTWPYPDTILPCSLQFFSVFIWLIYN